MSLNYNFATFLVFQKVNKTVNQRDTRESCYNNYIHMTYYVALNFVD